MTLTAINRFSPSVSQLNSPIGTPKIERKDEESLNACLQDVICKLEANPTPLDQRISFSEEAKESETAKNIQTAAEEILDPKKALKFEQRKIRDIFAGEILVDDGDLIAKGETKIAQADPKVLKSRISELFTLASKNKMSAEVLQETLKAYYEMESIKKVMNEYLERLAQKKKEVVDQELTPTQLTQIAKQASKWGQFRKEDRENVATTFSDYNKGYRNWVALLHSYLTTSWEVANQQLKGIQKCIVSKADTCKELHEALRDIAAEVDTNFNSAIENCLKEIIDDLKVANQYATDTGKEVYTYRDNQIKIDTINFEGMLKEHNKYLEGSGGFYGYDHFSKMAYEAKNKLEGLNKELMKPMELSGLEDIQWLRPTIEKIAKNRREQAMKDIAQAIEPGRAPWDNLALELNRLGYAAENKQKENTKVGTTGIFYGFNLLRWTGATPIDTWAKDSKIARLSPFNPEFTKEAKPLSSN